MSLLQEKATAVAGGLEARKVEHRVAFDPTVIVVIISIITEIIKAWQECKKTPAQAVAEAKSLGLLERWRLRRIVRNHIADEEMNGAIGRQLYDALSGTSLTEAEVGQLYHEV